MWHNKPPYYIFISQNPKNQLWQIFNDFRPVRHFTSHSIRKRHTLHRFRSAKFKRMLSFWSTIMMRRWCIMYPPESLNANCPIVKISECCNHLLFPPINYMCIAICDCHFACAIIKLKSIFLIGINGCKVSGSRRTHSHCCSLGNCTLFLHVQQYNNTKMLFRRNQITWLLFVPEVAQLSTIRCLIPVQWRYWTLKEVLHDELG